MYYTNIDNGWMTCIEWVTVPYTDIHGKNKRFITETQYMYNDLIWIFIFYFIIFLFSYIFNHLYVSDHFSKPSEIV